MIESPDMHNDLYQCDVIVTCGRFAYQIVADLAKDGLKVCVVDSGDVPLFHSRYTFAKRVVPDYETDPSDYMDALVDIASKCGDSVTLMPLFDAMLVSEYRDRFPANVTLTVETFDKLSLLDDKKRFLDFAGRLGVPMPLMYADTSSVRSYPVVFKLVHGRSGDGVRIVGGLDCLNALISENQKEAFIITDFVEGEDFSIDCIRYGGVFFASSYKSFRKACVAKGSLSGRVVCNNPLLTEYARKVLDELDYDGICGFDFRISADGRVFLLEANPRFTGGSGLQISTGFRIPSMLYFLSNGKSILAPSSVDGKTSYSFIRNMSLAYASIAERRELDIRHLSLPLTQYEEYDRTDKSAFFFLLMRYKKKLVTILLYYLFRIRVVL